MSAPTGVEAIQRRTVRTLMVSQMLGGLGVTIPITVASVLAVRITGSEALGGLTQSTGVIGAALAAFVLARVMGAHGRRWGLGVGYATGSLGALVCVGAAVIARESSADLAAFVVLLAGALLLGANSATSYAARYAAADLATDASRGRALSLVLWATTVGAVLGPNLVDPASRLAAALALPELAGPFVLSAVITVLAALFLMVKLRPDPLLVSREQEELITDVVAAPTEASLKQPDGASNASLVGLSRRKKGSWGVAWQIAGQRPKVLAGMIALPAAHAVMVAVMVMTPIHMDSGGSSLRVIGLVISIHVLGMFAFSPVVGIANDRLGSAKLLTVGASLFWLAVVLAGTSAEGTSMRITGGLLVLGLAWSCCTIAASALITAETPVRHRTEVQGTADLTMNLAAGAAGGLSGVLVDVAGFGGLNFFAAVLVGGVLVSARKVATADRGVVAARPKVGL